MKIDHPNSCFPIYIETILSLKRVIRYRFEVVGPQKSIKFIRQIEEEKKFFPKFFKEYSIKILRSNLFEKVSWKSRKFLILIK